MAIPSPDEACAVRARPGGDDVVLSCTGMHKGVLTANALSGKLRGYGAGLMGLNAARAAVPA